MNPESFAALVPLPLAENGAVCALGPLPGEANVAVSVVTRVEEPLGAVVALLGAIIDDAAAPVALAEFLATIAPHEIAPNQQAFADASLLQLPPDGPLRIGAPDVLERTLASRAAAGGGPLLYCRKRHCVFAARSPRTGGELARQAGGPAAPPAAAKAIPAAWITTDWSGADGSSADGSGGDGNSAAGPALRYSPRPGDGLRTFDQLILDQGEVAKKAAEGTAFSLEITAELRARHTCATCPERLRCYPEGDGHCYAADRLVPLSASGGRPAWRRLGEWTLLEAGRIVGGLPPSAIAARAENKDAIAGFQAREAQRIEAAGPARLLVGESEGRELLELARVKLALVAGVLEQVDVAWSAAGRAHLRWTDHTVRARWDAGGGWPGTIWQFRPMLRGVGLHPLSPFTTRAGAAIAYPPLASATTLLAPEVADSLRYFDEPRSANVFIKKSKVSGESAEATILVEELGIAWELFCPADAFEIAGKGWTGRFSPLAARDKNDGAGLPFGGVFSGKVAALKTGEQADQVTMRWRPIYGQAVDLHAVGMLYFETLLWHEQWTTLGFRDALLKERADLAKVCLALPIEQREGAFQKWVAERSEVDAPAALWSRRNLFERREDRNATRLDAFPPLLWQAIVALGVRMISSIPGVSFCENRAADAPRGPSGLLLPLAEMRGLIALLDDILFGRVGASEALRSLIAPPRKNVEV